MSKKNYDPVEECHKLLKSFVLPEKIQTLLITMVDLIEHLQEQIHENKNDIYTLDNYLCDLRDEVYRDR
jgi:hypothetical protein